MRILLFIFLLATQLVYGQSANDALLISQNNIDGSARMTAMGGAFTSLGGDLSAMQLNPASGAVFLEGQAGFSYSFSNIDNSASFYNGGGDSNTGYNNINQAGIVFIIENTDSYSSILKYAFGINYNRTNNYNDNLSFKGNNNTLFDDSIGEGIYYNGDLMYEGYSSIATSFVLAANGFNPNDLGASESLAFNTYLIDMNIPIDPNYPDEGSIYYDSRYPTYTEQNPVYVMSAKPGENLQDYNLSRTGFSGQYNFSASLDIDNKLYLGVSYDRATVNMITNITLRESQFASDSEVDEIVYRSNVNTYGKGDGFSIGAIMKPTDFLRIGATYHSPTWYNLSDEFQYDLSVSNIIEGVDRQKSELYYSEYEIKTPAKIDAGLAYVFGKNGLLSVDYQFVDYAKTSMNADYGLEFENENIRTIMNSTHNIRIGTEWKVSFISLRAGYNYLQSPYKNKEWQSDTHRYSFGTGVNFKSWKLDLAYQITKRNYDYYIYETDLVEAANIDRSEGSFVATLRFMM